MRGVVDFEVAVQGGERDLHSGVNGGLVPEPWPNQPNYPKEVLSLALPNPTNMARFAPNDPNDCPTMFSVLLAWWWQSWGAHVGLCELVLKQASASPEQQSYLWADVETCVRPWACAFLHVPRTMSCLRGCRIFISIKAAGVEVLFSQRSVRA